MILLPVFGGIVLAFGRMIPHHEDMPTETIDALPKLVVHDAVASCTNVDSAHNLGHTGWICTDPGAPWGWCDDCAARCAECEARFDDPGHGWSKKCKARSKHRCKLTRPEGV